MSIDIWVYKSIYEYIWVYEYVWVYMIIYEYIWVYVLSDLLSLFYLVQTINGKTGVYEPFVFLIILTLYQLCKLFSQESTSTFFGKVVSLFLFWYFLQVKLDRGWKDSHVYIPFWVILQGVQGNASVVYDQDCIELAVKIHFCISNELEWLASSRDAQLVQQAPHRARLLRLHLHHLCPLRLHRSQRCVTFMQFLKVQFW